VTIKALVFDAYGTLFDVHSVITEGERRFPGRGAELSKLWRQKQLEYTWLRSLMGRYEDFQHITTESLVHSCAALGLGLDGDARRALMDAYLHLTPYPEVPAALGALAPRRLAILSNGSPEMLDAVVRNAGLGEVFDAVLSADALRIFKPHPSVYRLATEQFGIPAEEIGFVSSNFWDIAGAASCGFRTYWINRTGQISDELGARPVAVLSALDQLAALI